MKADSSWRQNRDVVHTAMKSLEKKEVENAEAFLTSTQTTEVTVRNSEILTQNRICDSGVGFRAVTGGHRVGFAATNDLTDRDVSEATERAFSISRVSSPLTDFALPHESKPAKVSDLFFSEVGEVGLQKVAEFAQRAVDAAEGFDKRVIAKDGRFFFQSGWRGVENTEGVDFEEQESRVVSYLGGVGKKGHQVTGGCFDLSLSRNCNLNPETLGEAVGKMVIDLFDPKPLKAFRGPVIFGPQAVSYQICDALIDGLKGENVSAGRSAWVGKIGQHVASKILSLEDNGVLDGGFSSRRFDDEGCPSRKTVLIEDGTLRSYLHDAATATSLNASNTGNASRFAGSLEMVHMIVGNGYRTKPEVYPSNLIIGPGSKSKEELVSEMKEGVLVESMAGFAQPGSGNISSQLSRAFYVRNGAVLFPIKGGLVSGNAFDWLKRVSDVGSDATPFMNALVPSLRVEDVQIIGG